MSGNSLTTGAGPISIFETSIASGERNAYRIASEKRAITPRTKVDPYNDVQKQNLPNVRHEKSFIFLYLEHQLFSASVHDGWGISDVEKGNAVKAGNTETMDQLAKDYLYRTLNAHGLSVGLTDGLMGNSEVG